MENDPISLALGVRDITDQLIPAHVPPGRWEALPAFDSTVVEIEVVDGVRTYLTKAMVAERHEACLERMARAAAGEDVPFRNVTKEIMCCYGLVKLCPGEEPTEEQLASFGRILTELLEKRIIVGRMTPICTVPLNPFDSSDLIESKEGQPRFAMLAYVYVDMPGLDFNKTHAKLNEIVGFEAFTKEGELPSEWPR